MLKSRTQKLIRPILVVALLSIAGLSAPSIACCPCCPCCWYIPVLPTGNGEEDEPVTEGILNLLLGLSPTPTKEVPPNAPAAEEVAFAY